MPKKLRPKTPTTIYSVPFNELDTILPVTTPLNLQPPPQPQLSEPDEERQYRLRRDMALDGYSYAAIDTAIARLNEPMALGANEPSFEKEIVLVPEPVTVEYSLPDLVAERDISQEYTPSTPTPSTPAEQGSGIPTITRHRGQRVQTSKAIYTSVPIQYRAAVDRLRERTRKSMKEVLCEAIADCAVKHGLTDKPGNIMGWPDWD